MAKMDFGLGAGAIRGRAGGNVFWHDKGRGPQSYTRTYEADVVQPRTPKQLRNRAVFRCCKAIWKGFSDPEKAYWKALATEGRTGWNAFTSYNLKQAAQLGWMPQLEVNEQHLGTPTAPTALAASVIDNAIVVTWTDATLSYTTGLHLGASAGFTPAMSNCVYATPATDGEDRQASILVAPGTYYLKARSGDEDGGEGAPTTGVGPLIVT